MKTIEIINTLHDKPVIRLVNLRWTASILLMLLIVRDDQAGVQYSNIGRTVVKNALVRIVVFCCKTSENKTSASMCFVNYDVEMLVKI